MRSARQLSLCDGPIDLVVHAQGSATAVMQALSAAQRQFDGLLFQLAQELPALRHAMPAPTVQHKVAKAMLAACEPHGGVFVTPMAAVAGAVADHLIASMESTPELYKCWVNNGGDIALWLSVDAHFDCAIVADMQTGAPVGTLRVNAQQPSRGIATSGWRGRSASLGIADAVTVVASSAAVADVAATLIANAVDLPDELSIERTPAVDIWPDSDLGTQRVTEHVPVLSKNQTEIALTNGQELAQTYMQRGLIHGAAVCLQGEIRLVGEMSTLSSLVQGRIDDGARSENGS